MYFNERRSIEPERRSKLALILSVPLMTQNAKFWPDLACLKKFTTEEVIFRVKVGDISCVGSGNTGDNSKIITKLSEAFRKI